MKKTDNKNVVKDKEQLKPSSTACGGRNWYRHFGKPFWPCLPQLDIRLPRLYSTPRCR